MKAVVIIKNLENEEEKKIILRNLSRIMDVRVIDIDVDNGILFFLYASPIAFQKVRQELSRIGFPVQSCRYPKADMPISYPEGEMKTLVV